MDKKNILKEIKSLIFSTDEKKEMFKDAKVGELIIRVEAEEFAEGLQVLLVTEDGVIPAGADLAGEHLLEDGTKITLDEAGVITKVEKTDELPVEAPVVEEELEEEMPVKEEEKEELVEEVKDEVVAELTARIEKLEAVVEEMLALSKDVAQFSKKVEDKLDNFIKDTPAELEFKSVKSQYNNDVKRNAEKTNDRLESIKNFRKK
jgi:hypothetical protein